MMRRVVAWAAGTAIAGLVVSLVVHVIMIAAATMLFVEFTPPGQPGRAQLIGEVTTITEFELAEMSQAPEQITPDVPESVTDPFDALAVADDQVLEDIAPSDTSVDVTASLGGGDVSDQSEIVIGGGGSANFFGIEATGDRFAYIVDVSTSMRDGDKIVHLRSELSRSVGALLQSSKFMVVTYSTDAQPLGGRERWSDANSRNKSWAADEIERLSVFGSTNPAPAFEIVFRENALPDAIYFMTDGEFARDVPDRIAELNAIARRPVHCILFGEVRSAPMRRRIEGLLTQIADQSGGTFRHVEIRP